MISVVALKSIASKYDNLSLREKLVLLLAAIACLFIIAYIVFIQPSMLEINALNDKQKNLQHLLEAKRLVPHYSDLSNNEEKKLSNKIVQLNNSLADINDDIAHSKKRSIQIDELSLLLKDILASNSQLSLDALKVFPVDKVNVGGSGKGNGYDVFKHSIHLKFTGDYSSVVGYLQLVESLAWEFFWESIEYHVVSHPLATVEINLYTLSIGNGE